MATSKTEPSVSASSPSPSPPAPAPAPLEANAQLLFDTMAKYIQGELALTNEEYRLLEQMNRHSTARYAEMTRSAATLVDSMGTLQLKYKQFESYLAQIDQIDAGVTELEAVVLALDQFTSTIEEQFNALAAPPVTSATPASTPAKK